ncbi:MAG: hypothetical protein QOK35_2487 [Pseudonocardiales bacterium]|nr:hypothetical protein [Pseudonocardiales bacterium]
MTTSDPQADRRDDDSREHRSIGQRIRDAVLGDPADEDRRDAPADAGYADAGHAERRDSAYAEPRTGAEPDQADPGPIDGHAEASRGAASGAPGYTASGRSAEEGADGYVALHTDRTDTDHTDADRGYVDRTGTDRADTDHGYAGSADPEHGGRTDSGYARDADTGNADAGYAGAGNADTGYGRDAHADLGGRTDTDPGYAGNAAADHGGRTDTERGYTDAGTGLGHPGADHGQAANADTDREYAPYEQAMREHTQGGAVPDPVRDDVTQEGTARPVGGHLADDRSLADRSLADRAGDDRSGFAGRDVSAASDTGYDDRAGRTEGVYTDTRADSRADTAPGDQDFVTSSYDPDRDAGYDPQAAGTAATGAGTTGAAFRDERDVREGDVRGDQAYDTRSYDPATDTGYPGEDAVGVDRAVGRGDADYDTGRVDTGRAHPVERDTRQGAGTGAAAAVAGGAAVAAGAAATHHRQDDRGDTRFSEVDDTTTVDPSPTGRATPDATGASTGTSGDAAADRRAEAVAEDDSDRSEGGRERLVPAERAQEYSSRWDALKGDFVDEPRRAVAQADDLVGELLDEIQRLFADQRRDLEQGFDHDQASTEDLRLALRRYRSFFDRLLSF